MRLQETSGMGREAGAGRGWGAFVVVRRVSRGDPKRVAPGDLLRREQNFFGPRASRVAAEARRGPKNSVRHQSLKIMYFKSQNT